MGVQVLDPDTIDVTMRFTVRGAPMGTLYTFDYEANTIPLVPHQVRVADARPIAERFTLDEAGFTLIPHATKMGDFYDPAQVTALFYPEVERLLLAHTGAEKVVVVSHLVRRDDPSWHIHPARNAHLDYPESQYHSYAKQKLGEAEGARWLKRRFMGINVWMPLKTVLSAPLAVCDGRTVDERDLVLGEIKPRPGDDSYQRFGFNLAYEPGQRWYYFRHMRPDEVLLLKIVDSDKARTQGAPHSAIDDPTTPADAPPRESIEVRAIAFMPE